MILGIAAAYQIHRIYDSYKPVTVSLQTNARRPLRRPGVVGLELSRRIDLFLRRCHTV